MSSGLTCRLIQTDLRYCHIWQMEQLIMLKRLVIPNRNFLLPLSYKVFRHKKRGTIFLCWLFHLPIPANTCGTRHKATGLASVCKRKSPFFFGPQDSTRLTFFKIPQILRARFRCMTSFTSYGQIFYLGFLFWYLWTTHPPRAFFNTCAQVCT